MDFQLFILGVVLLYLYTIKKGVFLVASIALMIFSLIFNFVYTFSSGVTIFTDL